MSAFDYKLSTITKYRAGTIDDPFVDVVESKQVINNVAILSEIPSKLHRVIVSGFSELSEDNDSELGETNFRVDYVEGLVYFHSSTEGTTQTFTYKGRGNHYVSSARIWTREQDGEVTQTLSDLTEGASNFLDVGTYNPSTTYNTYNIVQYLGSSYMCKSTTTGNVPTNTSYWTRISGYSFKGTYSTGTNYVNGDVVVNSENTILYQSKTDNNTNNALSDTDNWQKLIDIQTTIDSINVAEDSRVLSENSRADAEELRVLAEQERVNEELSRSNSEDLRVLAELSRVDAEDDRVSAENIRQLQESDRQTNTTNAISNLNDVVSSWSYEDAYDNLTSYIVNNTVTYNNETYICIQNTTGNLPTNSTYWRKIAASGSVGSVTSTNGDITVTNPTTSPELTLNSGTGANQIVKRNSEGYIEDVVTIDEKIDNLAGVGRTAETVKSNADSIADHETRITTIEDDLESNLSPIPATINQGTSILNVTHDGILDNYQMRGRTLVNLLGNDGNCESLTPFSTTGTVALSTAQKRSGNNSIKITPSAGHGFFQKNYTYSLGISKQYFVGGWVFIESFTSGTLGIRLYDADGVTLRYSVLANTTIVGNWQFIYVKLPSANTFVGTGFRAIFGTTGTSTVAAYFDEIRLFELSSAEYTTIGTTYTASTTPSIDDVFPYVDNRQSIRNPYAIASGKNLLSGKGTPAPASTNDITVNGPYDERWVWTAGMDTYLGDEWISVPKNTDMTFSYKKDLNSNNVGFVVYNKSGVSVANLGTATVSTFNTGDNDQIKMLSFRANGASGDVRVYDWMLNVGSTALLFKQQNKTYKFFHGASDEDDFVLRSNADGTIYDELIDGEKILRRFKEAVLDGSLNWAFNSDYAGFKRVAVYSLGTALGAILGNTSSCFVIKHDGTVLPNDLSASSAADYGGIQANGNFVLSIADAESGLPDSWAGATFQKSTYTNLSRDMSASEIIRAIMNGWRWEQGGGYWIAQKNNTIQSSNADTVVSTYATADWIPYKLQYQLAAPQVVEVISEGDINVFAGDNQITMSAGVFVREAVSPQFYNSDYHIALNTVPPSNPKNRTLNILEIQKDNDEDALWIVATNSNPYGKERAYINPSNFDQTGAYAMTYTALDMYKIGIAPQSVDVEYQSNLGTVVGQLTKENVALRTELDTVKSQYARRQQGGFINGFLLAAWSGTLKYRRNDLGQLQVVGDIIAGTLADGTVIAQLPTGYAPTFSHMAFPVYDGVQLKTIAGFILTTDGKIMIRGVSPALSGSSQVRFNILVG